jgi:hypothetical protein
MTSDAAAPDTESSTLIEWNNVEAIIYVPSNILFLSFTRAWATFE